MARDSMDSDEVDDAFEQLSQSQKSTRTVNSQRSAAAPVIPQSNVGNRRKRRIEAAAEDAKLSIEPGFGSAPVDISRKKRDLLDAMNKMKAKAITKKDCFQKCFLDDLEVARDCVEDDLGQSADLIQCSAIVYGMRVDTTYLDAVSTNCQLQPVNASATEVDGRKKTKAEQKFQESTTAQQRSLQKLQGEIQQDEAEDDNMKSITPELLMEMDGPDTRATTVIGGGEEEGERVELVEDGLMMWDNEDREGSVNSDERRKKNQSDQHITDTSEIKFTTSEAISELVKAEYERRGRNLDRKCNLSRVLMDDEKKFRLEPAAILNNEYYHVATSRYKDLNAGGLLTYNAKVTHNARMTLMHKRMETWMDVDAYDYSEPSREFRKALSGLVENSMRKIPVEVKNNLFDEVDCVMKKEMTTGKELLQMEEDKRNAILENKNGLDNYEPENEKDNEEEKKKAEEDKILVDLKIKKDAQKRRREDGQSTSNENGESVDAGLLTAEKEEDLLVAAASIHEGRKRRIAGCDLSAVSGEDTIPHGPTLTVTHLASQFNQILFEKLAMGSSIKWEHGADAEELQADLDMINSESQAVEEAGIEDDLRDMDEIWNSKVYSIHVRGTEGQEIMVKEKAVANDDGTMHIDRLRRFTLSPGEHEMIGEDDNPRDEIPNDRDKAEEMLEGTGFVRKLHDEAEKKAFEMKLMGDDDEDDTTRGDDERIHIEPEMNGSMHDMDNYMDDDGGGTGTVFSDNDEETTNRRVPPREDDVYADMPEFVNPNDLLPSSAVRDTGKADASHWKGGKVELAKGKKNKKKNKKGDAEDEPRKSRQCFKTNDDMANCHKVTSRFTMVERSSELMKDMNEVLLPIQVNVARQITSDTTQFFTSFFVPKYLHRQYRFKKQSDESENLIERVDEEEELLVLDNEGHLVHYTRMMDKTIGDGGVNPEDVYLSFMGTFKDYPEVPTGSRSEEGEEIPISNEESSRGDVANPDEAWNGDNDEMDMGGGGFDDDGGEEAGVELNGEEERRVPASIGDIDANFNPPPPPPVKQKEQNKLRSNTSMGYGIQLLDDCEYEDEGDAVATVGGREYHLRQIKLDTVAMHTALSDVFTNPMMDHVRLDETLNHFNRVIPSQQLRSPYRAKSRMQMIPEDGEMESPVRREEEDEDDEYDEYPRQVNIEDTMREVPGALDVTRALFAPPKEKVKEGRTMKFAKEEKDESTSKEKKEKKNIDLAGHHTLKSAFTCLPARLPVRSSSEVTVASTIAMILHMANENDLILKQDGQMDEVTMDGGGAETNSANWMTDFEVECANDDQQGSKMKRISKSFIAGAEVLSQLRDGDAVDSERRQKETKKILADMAAQQKEEAAKEKEEEERKRLVEQEEEEERKRMEEEEMARREEEEKEERRRMEQNEMMRDDDERESRSLEDGDVIVDMEGVEDTIVVDDDDLIVVEERMGRRRDEAGPSNAVYDDSDDDIIDVTTVPAGDTFHMPAAPPLKLEYLPPPPPKKKSSPRKSVAAKRETGPAAKRARQDNEVDPSLCPPPPPYVRPPPTTSPDSSDDSIVVVD